MTHAERNTTASRWRVSNCIGLSLAASASFLAGCVRSTMSDQQPPAPAPIHQTAQVALDRVVQDTCARFTIIALSTDAAIDLGPADARRRAAQQFGTPALADRLAGEGRDHHWPLLAHHHAHVEVTTTPVTDDPPTLLDAHDSQAAAGVVAHRTAIGPDGWKQALPSTVAYCSLSRSPDGWWVTDITFADTISGPVTP